MRGDVCATYLSGFLVYEDEEYSFGVGWQLRSSVIDARAGFYAAECDPHRERADLRIRCARQPAECGNYDLA